MINLPRSVEGGVAYDMITEETLDDWFAQSINRSIPSMLNPQKKFYMPVFCLVVRVATKRNSRVEMPNRQEPNISKSSPISSKKNQVKRK